MIAKRQKSIQADQAIYGEIGPLVFGTGAPRRDRG